MARGSIQKLKNNPPSDGSGDQGKKNGGGDRSSILGVLIGSKTDLKDQRVISPKAAQDFASEHGLQYYECSAVKIAMKFILLANLSIRNLYILYVI